MVKKIVIVGGGSSGWMTAAYLSVKLKDVDITLIESSDIPIIGVGESTIPPMVEFMKALGLKEKDWMPQCNATYKSAIRFRDYYSTTDPDFWYSFEPMANVGERPVGRYWYNKHLSGSYPDRQSFFDYCFLAPEMCRQGKTLTSLSGYGPAYQLDAGLLGEFLMEMSKKNGVERIIDTINEVNLTESGSIKSLSCEKGPDIEGDLFIDCSGFRSLLLGEAMGEPFGDYYDYLFNDKAVALRYPYEDKEAELFPYTKSTAVSAGWVWQIPLYSRRGSGYVYCSRHKSGDEAETELRQMLGEERLKDVEARHLDFRAGKHDRVWVKNCLGIGLSAGFVEPLESTGLFIVQLQAETLAHVLGSNNDYNAGDVKVYNQVMDELYNGVRDFLICHFVLTEREDTPYWREVKYETKIPDSLGELLRYSRMTIPDLPVIMQFYRPNFGDYSFTDGWQSILIGMNYLPSNFNQFQRAGPFEHQVVKNMGKEDQRYANQEQFKKTELPNLPSHYQYLKDTIYDGRE
jgi:tryptophan halogenase